MVKVEIEKTDYDSPAEVLSVVQELGNWRKVRANANLPVGALDNAIARLENYRKLLGFIYLEELNG